MAASLAASSLVRADARLPNQLRPLSADAGALTRADGSARFRHDRTEVLVAVYGPVEARRNRERVDGAYVEVLVRPRAGLPGPPERELEQLLGATLRAAIITSLHPRTAISIVVQVIADDGALLSAALNGATLALLHAAIPMRGPAVGCTIALLPSGAALLDPTADEERDAAAVVTLGYLLRDLQGLGAERQLLHVLLRRQVLPLQVQRLARRELVSAAAQQVCARPVQRARRAGHVVGRGHLRRVEPRRRDLRADEQAALRTVLGHVAAREAGARREEQLLLVWVCAVRGTRESVRQGGGTPW